MIFWREFLDLLEVSLADPGQVRALLAQARIWLDYGEMPKATSILELTDWKSPDAPSVSLAPGLPCRRRGDPGAFALLLRALASATAPSQIQIDGDNHNLVLSPGPEGRLSHPDLLLRHLCQSLQAVYLKSPVVVCRLPWPALVTPGESAVDVEVLERSTMGDEEFEAELISTYLKEARQLLDSLKITFSRRTLHSLKGSAAMVGARQLAALLDEQERVLDPESLPKLESEFVRVEKFLRDRLKNL